MSLPYISVGLIVALSKCVHAVVKDNNDSVASTSDSPAGSQPGTSGKQAGSQPGTSGKSKTKGRRGKNKENFERDCLESSADDDSVVQTEQVIVLTLVLSDL